jgi:hypothetical protein
VRLNTETRTLTDTITVERVRAVEEKDKANRKMENIVGTLKTAGFMKRQDLIKSE